MNVKNETQDSLDTLQAISSWPFAILIGYLVFMILIMQGIFSSISGLYFPYAYEAIVFPYTIYTCIYMWSKAASTREMNTYRPALMAGSFIMLFTPAIYLLLTEQVDLHTMMFGEFNSELKHMPFSSLLPYLCFVALLVPLPKKNFDSEE